MGEGPRILRVKGPSMGLHYHGEENRGEYAAQSLAFELRGPELYERDQDGSWFPALVWDKEHDWRVFSSREEGMAVTQVKLERWGHILPVPEDMLLELRDQSGNLLAAEIVRDELVFQKKGKELVLSLRRWDDQGRRRSQPYAVLVEGGPDGSWPALAAGSTQGAWQALAGWGDAWRLVGDVRISVPAHELALAVDLTPGERARLSGLAERR